MEVQIMIIHFLKLKITYKNNLNIIFQTSETLFSIY